MTTANVVFSGPVNKNDPLIDEAQVATGQTILPGHLVLKSSGEWINHDAAGDAGPFRIANLNIFEQKGVSDALTVGQDSEAFVPVPGEEYNVVVAASQTVVVDSPLTSNGDGTVKVATVTGATPDVVLFYAQEAATTGVGETARVRSRVATAGYNATA